MSKFKYIILGMLIGMFIPCTAVFAQSQIKLIVNGKEIQSDVAPQTINGRTMIPARALAEALGATVSWNAQENAITITSNGVGKVSSDAVVESVKEPVKEVQPAIADSVQYINIDSAITEPLMKKGYRFVSDDTYTYFNFEKLEPASYKNTLITQLTRGVGEYKGYVLKSEFDKYVAPILNQ